MLKSYGHFQLWPDMYESRLAPMMARMTEKMLHMRIPFAQIYMFPIIHLVMPLFFIYIELLS